MLHQQLIAELLEKEFQNIVQQSQYKNIINLSYINLTKSKKFSRLNFFYNYEKYFEFVSSEIIQSQIQTLLQTSFLHCEINHLAKSFIVKHSPYKCWPNIISHLSYSCKFLTSLRLSFCKISDDVLELISKADWKFVKSLDLSKNNISWKGVRFLRNTKWLYLQCLLLDSNRIANKGLSQLVKNDWPQLQCFSIQYNLLTSDGLKYFSRCSWRNLRLLFISDIFGNEGFKDIIKMETTIPIQLNFPIIRQDEGHYSQQAVNNFKKMDNFQLRY